MGPEKISLVNVAEEISDLWIRILSQYVKVGPMPAAGPASSLTLPIRELEPRPTTLKYFLDIIYDFEGPINHDQLGPILRDQAWDELPAPFKFTRKLEVKYLMQDFVLTQTNGQALIIKLIFLPDNKIKTSLVSGYGYGILYKIIRGPNPKTAKKCLQNSYWSRWAVSKIFFLLLHPNKRRRQKL